MQPNAEQLTDDSLVFTGYTKLRSAEPHLPRDTGGRVSVGIQKPRRLHWRNRSAGCAKDRDKTHLDESQAFHRTITDIVRPGLDWPLGLNRQPAVACTGTAPSTGCIP